MQTFMNGSLLSYKFCKSYNPASIFRISKIKNMPAWDTLNPEQDLHD